MKVFETFRIFCPTLITKIVNIYISGSTQPFFTKQEPLDSRLDNKSFHYTIEMFSTTFRNSPESLLAKLRMRVRVGVPPAPRRDCARRINGHYTRYGILLISITDGCHLKLSIISTAWHKSIFRGGYTIDIMFGINMAEDILLTRYQYSCRNN